MRHLLATLVCLAPLTAGVRADDGGIPVETLRAIKDATVFVKIEAGSISGSGSGFVVQTDNDTALIVTNQHVIAPPAQEVPFGRSRFLRQRITPDKPVITVVLHSGTSKEQAIKASILAADADKDLAVLKVAGIKEMPRPIEYAQAPQLVETMPIYVFGFPFGEVLSTGKGNPAITVGKGSISSIRLNDRGELARVQIDGALNPGNSGGPVVDSKGRLVGVSVATIRGATGIGLAIPPTELQTVLEGRVGGFKAFHRRRADGQLEVKIELDLIDPLRKLKELTLHYVPGEPLKNNKDKKVALNTLPESHKVELKIQDQKAIAVFSLPGGKPQEMLVVTWQAAYIPGEGKISFTPAQTTRIRPSGKPSDDDRFLPATNVTGRPQPGTPQAPGLGGHPATEVVTIEIEGIADDTTRTLLPDRLAKLADGMSHLMQALPSGNKLVVRLAPVKNPESFAEKIDFATVTAIEGRVVRLTARKLEAPLADTQLVTQALIDMRSSNSFTRRAAADKLAKLRPNEQRDEVAPVLEAMAKDNDHFTRQSGIKALAVWGTKAQVPTLLALLTSPDVFTRQAAMAALGSLKDERAIQPLAMHLTDGGDRGNASKALQNMGPAAEKEVARYIQHPDVFLRREVCLILKVIGTAESKEVLETASKDSNRLVAAAAEEALQAIAIRGSRGGAAHQQRQ